MSLVRKFMMMVNGKKSYKSFVPPQRTLMGPGPSDVSPNVLKAMARPTIGHLDPEFIRMMEEVKELLQYAFNTKNKLTIPLSGPGSLGMETCFANLLEPGEKVVVGINGVFGNRMVENVERMGGVPVKVEHEWGTPVAPQRIEDALKEHPDARILAFVHAETSTGVRSDAETLCKLAQKYDCLSLVDAVTSLGGIELRVDDWGIDAIYSGTQKCLSVPPGLSPISFSERAIEKVKSRKTPVWSWFQDVNQVMAYWDQGEGSKRSYHHTAPINGLYGLHEALKDLHNEGLEASWKRHAEMHERLRQKLERYELEFLVAPEYRLPQLNSIRVLAGIDEAAVRKFLLEKYSLEIGAGLGALQGKIWRIGLMGHGANKKNVDLCDKALRDALEVQLDNMPSMHA